MAKINTTTATENEPLPSTVPIERIEIAQEAAYELDALAVHFPRFFCDKPLQLTDEYIQRLFINRVKELASLIMSALSDDQETNELRRIVGLSEVKHGH